MFGYNIQYVWLQYMSGFRVTVEPDNTVRSFCFSCCRLCFLCREFDYFWHSVLVHTFLLCFVESREQRPSCGLAENSEDFFLLLIWLIKKTLLAWDKLFWVEETDILLASLRQALPIVTCYTVRNIIFKGKVSLERHTQMSSQLFPTFHRLESRRPLIKCCPSCFILFIN